MKCLVCGLNYSGNTCPRCQFPYVESPSLEMLIQTLRPAIESYRKQFLEGLGVDVVIFHWKDQDGVLAVDQEERLSLGRGDLRGKTRWLKQKFARVPAAAVLPVQLVITAGGKERRQTVEIPNLEEAELQELGLRVDEQFCFQLLLRTQSGKTSQSPLIPLFPDSDAALS